MTGTIRAFVGPNGSGKSLCAMVNGVIPSWRQGRPCIGNAEMHPEALGLAHELAQPLDSWRTIVNAQGVTLFLDEITSVLPSRAFGSVPAELQRVLNQLRKVDVDVLWTAPTWARADVMLREVTQEVTVCAGFFDQWYERTAEGVVRDEDGKKVRRSSRWPAHKLFRWLTYEAQDYDDFQEGRSREIKPRFTQWYWRPRHGEQWAYTTLAPVSLLDHLDDIGRCVHCNRQRRREYCKCVPEEMAEAGAAAPAAQPAEVWV